MSADPAINYSVVLIGCGNQGLNAEIVARLKQIDQIMIVDVKQPIIYELKAIPREPINFLLKEHGTYRQFEKRDKRKNFR